MPNPKTIYGDTEIYTVPAAVSDLARRRTAGIFRALIFHPNALEKLMMSCAEAQARAAASAEQEKT